MTMRSENLTTSQAAELIGIHRKTAWQWAKWGRLGAFREGRRYFFPRGKVERYARLRAEMLTIESKFDEQIGHRNSA